MTHYSVFMVCVVNSSLVYQNMECTKLPSFMLRHISYIRISKLFLLCLIGLSHFLFACIMKEIGDCFRKVFDI